MRAERVHCANLASIRTAARLTDAAPRRRYAPFLGSGGAAHGEANGVGRQHPVCVCEAAGLKQLSQFKH